MNTDQITQLINQYGQTAFNAAMKQVAIDTVIMSLALCIFGILLIATTILLIMYRNNKDDLDLPSDKAIFACASFGVVFALTVIATPILVSQIVSNILNPELSALHMLLPR